MCVVVDDCVDTAHSRGRWPCCPIVLCGLTVSIRTFSTARQLGEVIARRLRLDCHRWTTSSPSTTPTFSLQVT